MLNYLLKVETPMNRHSIIYGCNNGKYYYPCYMNSLGFPTALYAVLKVYLFYKLTNISTSLFVSTVSCKHFLHKW